MEVWTLTYKKNLINVTTMFGQLNFLYNRDGAVLVKDFLTNKDLELTKSAINFCIKNPSPFSSKITNGKKNSVFFSDYWTYKRNNFIQNLLSKKEIVKKIKEITGNKDVYFFHDHVLVKDPGSPSTPWHHDRPYYFLDGPNNFSIWITPDEVSEENSLAFCAGSHKSNNIYVPINFNDGSDLQSHPDLKKLDEQALMKESKNGILVFKMKPGDAIIFNNKTLHRSMPSSPDKARSALSLRMLGDNCKLTNFCCSNPQPPFQNFGMELVEGASIDIKWFPKLPLEI